jgi:hypothetical protein
MVVGDDQTGPPNERKISGLIKNLLFVYKIEPPDAGISICIYLIVWNQSKIFI